MLFYRVCPCHETRIMVSQSSVGNQKLFENSEFRCILSCIIEPEV